MDLTEQHLALLRAAAERDDGLLRCPDRLVGAARRRMADRLLAAGVTVTVPTDGDQPHWFKDGEGASMVLRITEAGRACVESAPGQDADSAEQGGMASEGIAEGEDEEAPSISSTIELTALSKQAGLGRAHRPGTKRALLLDLLRRDGGATLAALGAALGWQPHTVRAALTRLRQDGALIDKVPGEGGTVYHIGADAADSRADAGASA